MEWSIYAQDEYAQQRGSRRREDAKSKRKNLGILFIRLKHLMYKKVGNSFWLLFVTLHTRGHGSQTVGLWKWWDAIA